MSHTTWMQGLTRGSGSVIALVFLFGIMMVTGCGQDKAPTAATPGGDTESIDLDDPLGGLTETDEAPGFGIPELIASAEADRTFEDVFENHPDVRNLIQRTGAQVYAMTITWGRLAEPMTDITRASELDGSEFDWTGSLSVSGGALLLRSVISFEPEDQVTLPRVDRLTLDWISHTGEGYDGIRVLVVRPRATDDAVSEITFDTPLYKRTFAIADLENLEEMVAVDDAGNKVRFQSLKVNPAAQNQGFLRGRWDPIREGELTGAFHGLWIGHRGEVLGYVRGHYGIDSSNQRVFFGKYVRGDGTFQGILRGTWGVVGARADGDEHGWFRGEWLESHTRTERGTVMGRWRAGGERPGYFDGRWCVGCRFPAHAGWE